MTSATDNRTAELREKLDALGIKHFDYDKGGRTQTMWESPGDDTRHFTYETVANPAKTAKLVIEWFPTPEQAVAATFGSGKCEWMLEHSGPLYDKWRCSSCGFQFVEPRCAQGYMDLEPNYCPNCGKAVKR